MTALLPCFAGRLTCKARAPADSESRLRRGPVPDDDRRAAHGKGRHARDRGDDTRLEARHRLADGSHGKARVAQFAGTRARLNTLDPPKLTVSQGPIDNR